MPDSRVVCCNVRQQGVVTVWIVPISLDDDWKDPGIRVTNGPRDLKPYLLDKN